MYVAPIVRAQTPAPPASPALRALAGVPTLLLATLVMATWLALNAAVSILFLGGLAVIRAPQALVQAIDYAGKVALGR